MFSALNQRLLSIAKVKIKPADCPNCGKRFTPFADREITSWFDFANTTPCPHCGHEYRWQSSQDRELAPSGPLPQPETSRIEKKPVAEGQVLYYIPSTGSGGGILAFAVIWNVFIGSFLAVMISGTPSGKNSGDLSSPIPFLFLLPFIAVGLGMAYAGLRAKYATHLLFLGPEFIRLQRQLFGRSKNYDLKTAEIDCVEQTVFYQQNRQPVYGIEIGGGKRRIRFGSALMVEEKKWLCEEIREFLLATGNLSFPALPPEPSATSTQPERDTSPEISDEAVLPPEKTGIVRETPRADEIVYHIPPCGRWGSTLPVGFFLTAIGLTVFTVVMREAMQRLPVASDHFHPLNLVGTVFDVGRPLITGAMALVGLGLLYIAIRHRFLRHRLTLNCEEVRLDDFFLRQHTRAIPSQEVKSMELFELLKMNDKPVSAIRVSGERQSFQFGFRLSDEEKNWLVADMRQFLRAKGMLRG